MFLMVTVNQLFTQVTITAVPPGPRFTLDDLWQLTLVKTGSLPEGQQLNVTLNIYDSQGSKILHGATKPFSMVKKNVLNINKTNINQFEPITITYYQNKFKNNLGRQGGLFPAGNYKVEFIINAVGGFTEPLGSTTYNIHAMLTYPIQLVSVYNNDTIKDPNPNFTWIPPYPLPEGNTTYKITISEIYPEQTAVAAVKENMPLSKKDVINNSTFLYSGSNPILEKGKEYAWNVNAYGARGEFFSGSETWRFIYDPEDTIDFVPTQYFLMNERVQAVPVYVDSNYLPIKFADKNTLTDSILETKIYNTSYNIVADDNDIPMFYIEGKNYTYINMCPDEFFLENGMYILEVVLVNGKLYYLRFVQNSSIGVCLID